MTSLRLQEELKKELKEISKSVQLFDPDGERSVLHTYGQSLPKRQSEDDKSNFPFAMVSVLGGKTSNGSKDEFTTVHIEILLGIYYDNPDMQWHVTMLNLIEKIIKRFTTNSVLGSFFCDQEIEYVLQNNEEETFPHFFGSLSMKWYLRPYEQEEW